MSASSFSSSYSTLSCPLRNREYMDSLIPPSRDQFEHIAHVQDEKEEEMKRRFKEQKRRLNHERQHSQHSISHQERAQAARVIQKTFRGYRARREISGFTLDPTSRWVTAIREAQFREAMRPRGRPTSSPSNYSQDTLSIGESDYMRSSTARLNWKKVSMVARRAGHDDDEEKSDIDALSDSEELSQDEKEEKEKHRHLREVANAQRRQTALTLGLQYWLEIVDSKHRYGTNLRMYHEEWRKANTHENFFYWLDYGEGRYISLQTCPRDRLERDQVRYLSREERQYYLATVDEQGRICWAKNGEPIDTSENYRDSIYGIVPVDDPAPVFRPTTEHPYNESVSDSHSTASSLIVETQHDHRVAKIVNPAVEEARHVKKVTQISATSAFNKLLRKTVKDGTWIFVADTSFRLYVGIKQAGAFQHSSFLQGGRISAGGLISIKEGKLTSLSPLSGHYRPPTSNFRAFVRSLKDEGVDVGHIPISKAYAVLYGLETYVKARHKGRDLMNKMIRGKDKVVHPGELKKRDEEKKDTSKSAEKERQVLAREKEQAEAEKHQSAVRAMHKLHILPLKHGNKSSENLVA